MPAIVGMRGSSQPVTMPSSDQRVELALAGDRVGEVQAGKLDLPRPVRRLQLIEKPVVQRPVILELQRAQRMRDALEGIGQRVREVVHRVDAPGVAGALMRDVPNAVQRRDRAGSCSARPCRSSRAARARRRRTRRRACAETDRGSPRRCDRGTGCSCPARSACRGTRGSPRR